MKQNSPSIRSTLSLLDNAAHTEQIFLQSNLTLIQEAFSQLLAEQQDFISAFPPTKLAYTYQEAAIALGFKTETVKKLCSQGKLARIYPLPGKPVISQKELVRFLEESPADRKPYARKEVSHGDI